MFSDSLRTPWVTHIGRHINLDKQREELSHHCQVSDSLECFGNTKLLPVINLYELLIDANSKKSYYILKSGKNVEGNGNINIGYENDK